jgi:ankyrin repeat protein
MPASTAAFRRQRRLLACVLLASPGLAAVAPAPAQDAEGGTVWWLDAAKPGETTLRPGAKPAWVDFDPVAASGNSFSPEGEAAAQRIIAAVRTGDLERVRRAVTVSGRPAARTLEGETGLAAAVRDGHFEIARYLLSQGADPNVRDAAGQTPLMATVLNENRWLARLLLRNGADPDMPDAVGQTPLVTAIRFGRIAAARELLAAGADADLEVAPLRTGMRRLFPAKGISGLMWAINEGQAEIVAAIVKRGARLNTQDDEGRTPLYWAVFYNEEAIARTLHAAGARLGRLAVELPGDLR